MDRPRITKKAPAQTHGASDPRSGTVTSHTCAGISCENFVFPKEEPAVYGLVKHTWRMPIRQGEDQSAVGGAAFFFRGAGFFGAASASASA